MAKHPSKRARTHATTDPIPTDPGVLLSKSQLAALLQVSTRTVDSLMARRQIAYLKIGRKIVRFRLQDFAQHVVSPTTNKLD
jgi:excisionase family DNA binding protein